MLREEDLNQLRLLPQEEGVSMSILALLIALRTKRKHITRSCVALLIYKYSVEVASRHLLITTRTSSRFTVAVDACPDLRLKLLHIFIDDCELELLLIQEGCELVKLLFAHFMARIDTINMFTVEAAMTGITRIPGEDESKAFRVHKGALNNSHILKHDHADR